MRSRLNRNMPSISQRSTEGGTISLRAAGEDGVADGFGVLGSPHPAVDAESVRLVGGGETHVKRTFDLEHRSDVELGRRADRQPDQFGEFAVRVARVLTGWRQEPRE